MSIMVNAEQAEAIKALIDSITEPTYKVGDRIEVLEDGAYFATVKQGDLGTVTGLDYDGELQVAMDNGEDEWVFRPTEGLDVKLTDEPKPEPEKALVGYKSGDRIEVLCDNACSADVRKGDKGTVESDVERGVIRVRMDGGRLWLFRTYEGEHIKPADFDLGNVVTVNYGDGSMWNGNGVVTDLSGGSYVCIKMLDGDAKGMTGGFAPEYLTFVSVKLDEPVAPKPSFAKGDRVLVVGEAATVSFIETVEGYSCGMGCCDTDGFVQVRIENDFGYSNTVRESDVESLDERELELVGNYSTIFAGDELIVATKEGHPGSNVPVGAKVTVQRVRGTDYGYGQLLEAEDADGNRIDQCQVRFAWA